MAIKCPKCNSENTDTARFCSNCAAPLPPSEEISAPTETLEAAREELTTGSTFAGRYQIIEELGKGGMGKVYRAIDKQLKEEVALKLIKPEISSDKRTVERFSNELKLARKIAHKNVGRMYELMEDKGTRFITMEYVPGEDLKSLTRRVKQLTVGTAISIAEQVCEGLSEAHRLGVVHRDLKPQNIMIDKEGNARIMDFGIARSITGKGITGAGVMIGTPEYMSPEQVEVKEVDQRSDIYSLGVILYEMVTGRVPFEGETPLGIALKHKSEVPKDPKELNAQIPDDLNLVILKCLEKDKDKRYQNAGEVRSELTRVEKSIPTTEIEIPKRKPITSREITLTFGLKKFLIPALVVIALVIVGVVIWQILLQKESIPIPVYKHSIAVLPFDDLSPQKDQEYFCDGIAEELINSLTKIKDLRVVARTSAFSFKGEKLDVREIGKKLNVATVLEGSVRKADNRLRITAQLINVEDGYHLWSERYDREMKDVFAIQDEISIAIVDSLKVRLLKEEKAKIVKHFTEDLEAYNLYLQGRYFWNKRTEKGLKKGVECFQQAIEKDPGYALAYAGLADSYVVLAGYAVLPPKEAFPKAKAAALKALELDEMLAEAHDSLANVLWEDERDSSSAEREFKRAIELKPSRAMSYKNYAEFLAELGRHEEAIAEIKRAQELDPLSLIINALAGWIFCMARQYDHAIEECRKVLEMDSQFIPAYDHLGLALIQKGMYEEAISAFQKAASLSSESPLYIANLAYTYAVAGKRNEAYRLLEELEKLSKQTYVPAYCMALIYTGLEEKEQALVWLEKANDEQYFRVLYIKEDPRFGSLKSHPGFTALLKKMGLE